MKPIRHLMDYPKDELSPEDKQELLGLIEDYRQVYLHPYPKELMLRNHV